MTGKSKGDKLDNGSASSEKLSFEKALHSLEQKVRQLEAEDMDLEEALLLFEQGIGLCRHCAGALEVARQRVDLLMTKEGGDDLESVPFSDAAAADGDTGLV